MQTIQAICNYIDTMDTGVFLLFIVLAVYAILSIRAKGW